MVKTIFINAEEGLTHFPIFWLFLFGLLVTVVAYFARVENQNKPSKYKNDQNKPLF